MKKYGEYVRDAEEYLAQAEEEKSNPYGGTIERSSAEKQALIQASIAASLIALNKKPK